MKQGKQKHIQITKIGPSIQVENQQSQTSTIRSRNNFTTTLDSHTFFCSKGSIIDMYRAWTDKGKQNKDKVYLHSPLCTKK